MSVNEYIEAALELSLQYATLSDAIDQRIDFEQKLGQTKISISLRDGIFKVNQTQYAYGALKILTCVYEYEKARLLSL